MANTFSVRRRQLAMKIEAVFGVDAVPTALDLIEPVFDLEYTAEIEQFEREIIKEVFSPVAQIPGERSAAISFTTELKGSGVAGTPPAHLDVPLRTCGFAVVNVPVTSDTYTVVSTGLESSTIEIREIEDDGDSIVKKLLGACGTVEITAEKGQPVLLNFEFIGKYVEPSRVASPGALSPSPGFGLTPEPFLDVGFTFLGIGVLLVQAVSLDAGVECTLKNDINDPSGNIGAIATARTPTGSINPEQVDPTVYNPWNTWTTAAEGLLEYTLGATAGNIVKVTAPNAQIVGISDGDRDTIRTNELELQLNGGVAGDDELELEFT